MPTGYTSPVEDGTITSLKDYALRCARAMGACVMQREEPLDVPPRKCKPPAYGRRALARARARLRKLRRLTVAAAQRQMVAERVSITRIYNSIEADRKKKESRYAAMLVKVEEWLPPAALASLKVFMLEQLYVSQGPHYEMPPPELPESPEEWLKKDLADAMRDAVEAERRVQEDKERCRDRNKWINTLYAALRTRKE